MRNKFYFTSQLSNISTQFHTGNTIATPLNGDPADIFPIPCHVLPIPAITQEDIEKQKRFEKQLEESGLYRPLFK